MNGLSKRLVSLTMATAMVFSLTAVPATEAKAAKASITSKTTSVQAGKTYTYKIKASKAKKVKVSVSGTAAKAVRVNGKKATSGITLKGGKTVTVKVKVNPSTTVAGKKFTINYKLDKKKAVKTKSIKVNYSTKGVTLDQTALTMKAGETATLKATMTTEGTNSKIKSWTSSNTEVATVKDGVVTAVAAGTADITVTTSNGKTATATVTVEGEKKPEAFTLTAEATKADTITGTLSREVAADATVTVTKAGLSTAVDGKATITGTTVEFKGTANFTNGTYTITVKEGEFSADATVTVQDEYVKEIVIKSKQALTNADPYPAPNADIVAGSAAYIYYDVLNQYGESLRQSTNIEWSCSATKINVDKNSGKITVTNGDHTKGALTPFTYGSTIYITGVYTKTGVSVQQAVTVGLAQALDSIEIGGFINKNEPSKIVETIPTDFGKNMWVLAYKALDQDGNNITELYPSGATAVVGDDVTLISDNPLLIKSDFDDDSQYTVNGELYNTASIQPGQYVDKGGEVSITAISNKTGNKTTKVLTVGEGALLQSLTLKQPTKVVASNDKDVEIPFVAKDTKGNDVTAYETIVRSSNTLNLTASEGDITIKEKNDGTAAITWTDSKYKFYGNQVINAAGSGQSLEDCDGYDRTVSLTTVVVGGTSDNMMLNVADTRVPSAIKTVKVLDSETNLVSAVNGYQINFMSNDVVYLDQYGDEMKTTDDDLAKVLAKNFFAYTESNTYGKGANAAYYGVGVDTSAKGSFINALNANIVASAPTYTFNTLSGSAVNTGSLKYSIISAVPTKPFSNASKVKVATYNIIPVAKLSGLGFNTLDKQQLVTKHSDKENGAQADALDNDSIIAKVEAPDGTDSIDVSNGSKVSVSGTYSGSTVYLPLSKWSQNTADTFVEDAGFTLDNGTDNVSSSSKEAQITSFVNGVSGNALSWNELYNANTARFERRDASKKLHTVVYDFENSTSIEVKANVALSDAPSIITTIEFDTDGILNPTNTNFDFKTNDWVNGGDKVKVKDQYGHTLTKDTQYTLSFKVDKYVENVGELAHVVNSYGITGNNSEDTLVTKAEIKDAFNLTITAEAITSANVRGSQSISKDMTFGADNSAKISTKTGDDTDEEFRKDCLKYDR